MTSDTFPTAAYAAGRTVIARYDEFGRREYEVVGEAFEIPERLPIAGYRPSRPRTVADVIQVPQSATNCPRCDEMVYEDHGVIICPTEPARCGWRSSYPLGTTLRGDGTSIFGDAP